MENKEVEQLEREGRKEKVEARKDGKEAEQGKSKEDKEVERGCGKKGGGSTRVGKERRLRKEGCWVREKLED